MEILYLDFSRKKENVFGIDNNQRKKFFGINGSVQKNITLRKIRKFKHFQIDILNKKIEKFFKKYNFDLIVHAAAQPSHDWSATNPQLDFNINTNGTLNISECIENITKSIFIYLSTNKVYGDVNYFNYKNLIVDMKLKKI